MLRLANRRATPRTAGRTEVKAYSNSSRVTLEVDGRVIGVAPVVDRVATWPDVVLAPGHARLRVVDDRGHEDAIEWDVKPGPVPAPADAHGVAASNVPLSP